MAKSFSIGLIGCGIWGRNILRDLLVLGHHVLVVDSDSTARSFADRHGASRTFSDVTQLTSVDGLIVATPASTHAKVVESVLDKGCPVFVEKPMADDVEDARRISELAPDDIFVMHIWAYHPGIEKLAELARNRILGDVNFLHSTRTNWTSPRKDVDIVWTALPHDITIAQAILGKIPEPVSSVAECIDGLTVGMLSVLEGPPHCVFNVSARYQDKRREVRLHCTEGVAVLPSGESGFIEIARGQSREPEVHRLAISSESALQRELRAFTAYLAGGPAPRSSARDGLRVVEKVARLRALAGLET